MAVDSVNSDCGRCLKPVLDSGNGLFCDGFCAKWYHAKCVMVSDKDYSAINKLSDVVLWLCEACVAKIQSMKKKVCDIEDCFKLHDLVGNLLSVVHKRYFNRQY